jgi:endoribonuclease Dicer
MENLEILGDCFLKLAVSMCLYQRYPSLDAGRLTIEKAKQISNDNLYRLAVSKHLRAYLNVTAITFNGPTSNWCPPGYVVRRRTASHVSTSKQAIHQPYGQQTTKRKAFADMIEAMIGAFLITTNYEITLQYMTWLGLDVIPLNNESNDHVQYSTH